MEPNNSFNMAGKTHGRRSEAAHAGVLIDDSNTCNRCNANLSNAWQLVEFTWVLQS